MSLATAHNNSISYINTALSWLCKPQCSLAYVWSLCFCSWPEDPCFAFHAPFYGCCCRRWGKARIQALPAEVIRSVTDCLRNVLVLKAWCPGTPALSHVDPHSQASAFFTYTLTLTHTHTHTAAWTYCTVRPRRSYWTASPLFELQNLTQNTSQFKAWHIKQLGTHMAQVCLGWTQ